MNYKEYLKSDSWKEKKSLKKKRCGICGSEDLIDIHHLSYKNIFNEELSDLRAMCRRCHFLGHELFDKGLVKFTSTNHHSRRAILKSTIKKELGISCKNMFN